MARTTPQSTLPADWKLTDKLIAYAVERGLDAQAMADKFTGHHVAKGSKFANWDAAFQNWCRTEVSFRAKRAPQPKAKPMPIVSDDVVPAIIAVFPSDKRDVIKGMLDKVSAAGLPIERYLPRKQPTFPDYIAARFKGDAREGYRLPPDEFCFDAEDRQVAKDCGLDPAQAEVAVKALMWGRFPFFPDGRGGLRGVVCEAMAEYASHDKVQAMNIEWALHQSTPILFSKEIAELLERVPNIVELIAEGRGKTSAATDHVKAKLEYAMTARRPDVYVADVFHRLSFEMPVQSGIVM
jgi:hypothetical protein